MIKSKKRVNKIHLELDKIMSFSAAFRALLHYRPEASYYALKRDLISGRINHKLPENYGRSPAKYLIKPRDLLTHIEQTADKGVEA